MMTGAILQSILLGLAIAMLLAGVCLLPYAFPPQVFVKGASYEAGFNNGVAYLWYLLFFWPTLMLLTRVIPTASGTMSPFSALATPVKTSRLLWIVLGAHALLFAALYTVKGQFVFAEAVYFQTLLYRMTLGEVPYVDFSFYYGPAMLYPGYVLARLLTVESGYALYFVVTYLAGLYLLYLVVRAIVVEERASDRWYLLLALGLFNPWTGLNVTFVRYLLPIMAMASAVSYFRSGGRPALVWAVGWLALSLLYTFEAGVVALVSVVFLVGAALCHRWVAQGFQWLAGAVPRSRQHAREGGEGRRWLGEDGGCHLVSQILALVGLAGLLFFLAFYIMDPSLRALMRYHEIALSYSAGAFNMPIRPNLPFLTLVLLTLVGFAGVLVAIRDGKLAGEESLAAGWLVLALLMERGAFGVAEPTHFAYYGIPVFCLCLFVLRRIEIWWRSEAMLAMLLVVGIAVPLQYYNSTLFFPVVGRTSSTVEAREAKPSLSQREAVQQRLTTMVERLGQEKPYLMFELDYYSFPVYHKLGLRYPTYFTLLSNARTKEDMRLILDQLRDSKAIILARQSALAPSPPPADRSMGSRWLDRLSGGHASGSELAQLMQKSHERLQKPLMDLMSSYEVVEKLDGFVALMPRSQNPP